MPLNLSLHTLSHTIYLLLPHNQCASHLNLLFVLSPVGPPSFITVKFELIALAAAEYSE